MKVLFLEVDTSRDWAVASIGPACLAAVLREAGHEAALARIGIDAAADDVVRRVRDAAPDLLALSLTSRQWLRARTVVAQVRAAVDVPVIAGGLHPTFSPASVLSAPGFDVVCLGEGEAPLLDLVDHLEARGDLPCDLDNLWVRGGARPPLRPPVASLDDLPDMARDFLDEPPGVAHVTTQRGCPFPCTYCAARNFDELYRDTAVYGRRRSHAHVLDELERLEQAGGLSYVIFLDDTFTIHRPWVEEFCRRYGERFGLPFSLHARVDTVDAPLLTRLAAAGCRHITYGVESGSERVRREVMERPITDARIHDAVRWTRDAGILVTANYMLGLPDETPDDLARTVALAEALPVDDFGFFVFYPYPGTRLFEKSRALDALPADYLDRPVRHDRSLLRLPTLSAQAIQAAYQQLTALRERLYQTRYQGVGSPAAVAAEVRRQAALG